MANDLDTVAYTVEDGIAWLRFNRPDKRNAMSPTLNRAMMEALDALEFREDVGVLVLTGEGAAWTALDVDTFLSAEGATLTRGADGVVVASGNVPEKDTYTLSAASTAGNLAKKPLRKLPS